MFATILIGIEDAQGEHLERIAGSDRVTSTSLAACGGTTAAVELVAHLAAPLVEAARREPRERAPLSALIVGLECSERCSISATLRSGRRRVGRGALDLEAAGRSYLFVDLARTVRRLRRGRRMRVRLELAVVDGAGNRATVRRSLTIVGDA